MHLAKIKYPIKQEIGVDYARGKLRNALTVGGKVQCTMSGKTCTCQCIAPPATVSRRWRRGANK